jgi:hypothetical protein
MNRGPFWNHLLSARGGNSRVDVSSDFSLLTMLRTNILTGCFGSLAAAQTISLEGLLTAKSGHALPRISQQERSLLIPLWELLHSYNWHYTAAIVRVVKAVLFAAKGLVSIMVFSRDTDQNNPGLASFRPRFLFKTSATLHNGSRGVSV